MSTYGLLGLLALALCARETGAEPLAQTVDLAAPDAAAQWSFIGGEWQVREGRLEQTDLHAGETDHNLTAHAFLRAPGLADFTFRVQFRIAEAGVGVRAAELLFRSADSRTYYLVQYSSAAGQVMLVWADRQNLWVDIARRGGFAITRGEWHEAQVEARGPRLRVYFDGQLAVEAEDTRYPAGLIGLGTSQGRVEFKDLHLEGETVDMAPEWQLIPQQRPHPRRICTDAGAGGYQAFPDVARLHNGDLLCVFYAGYEHVSHPNEALPNGARVCGLRSTDHGATWSDPFVVADTPFDDRDPSVAQLSDGTVVCNFFTYYHGGPKRREGNTVHYKEVWLTRSTDAGHTWTEPSLIESTVNDHWACSTPIRERPDGSLILPLYREYPDPLRTWSAMITSQDGGQTWSAPAWVDEENDDNDEPDVVALPDGRWLCVMRTNRGDSMWKSVSQDGGQTWSRAEKIGFYGQAPYLLYTSQGVLLCAHRGPGTSLYYSLDAGETWSENVLLDACGGAYPSMTELPDGRVLCVYYEEGPGSAIRAVTFRATAEGIVFDE